jgi:hypothetical protein
VEPWPPPSPPTPRLSQPLGVEAQERDLSPQAARRGLRLPSQPLNTPQLPSFGAKCRQTEAWETLHPPAAPSPSAPAGGYRRGAGTDAAATVSAQQGRPPSPARARRARRRREDAGPRAVTGRRARGAGRRAAAPIAALASLSARQAGLGFAWDPCGVKCLDPRRYQGGGGGRGVEQEVDRAKAK